MSAVLVDLDALGDTRALWEAWLRDDGRVLGISLATLPGDRVEATAVLDAGGTGNWRSLLERFAEDRAPVYLRPAAEVSAALRRLAGAGTVVGVYTDAPVELARVALAQLGASRRIARLEAGAGALDRLRAELGPEARVLTSREDLVTSAT